MNLSEHPKLQKIVRFLFRLILGLCAMFIGALIIGLLIVGPPQAPAYENFGNALITLSIFLVAELTIYIFIGGWRKKK